MSRPVYSIGKTQEGYPCNPTTFRDESRDMIAIIKEVRLWTLQISSQNTGQKRSARQKSSQEQKKSLENTRFSRLFGGDEGDRTPYLLNAIQALSQVSYTPMFEDTK